MVRTAFTLVSFVRVALGAFAGLLLASAGGVLLRPEPAQAGAKSTRPVVVVAERSASGSTGTARNSSNSVEFIRCGTTGQGSDADGSGVIECIARNAADVEARCTAPDGMVWPTGALSLMADGAFLSFTVDQDTGHCLDIGVVVASDNEPKRP